MRIEIEKVLPNPTLQCRLSKVDVKIIPFGISGQSKRQKVGADDIRLFQLADTKPNMAFLLGRKLVLCLDNADKATTLEQTSTSSKSH